VGGVHHPQHTQTGCNTVFPRDMVCLMNISVDTLHKENTEDNNNNNNNNNNSNNNNNNNKIY
jgi:hypothetical protein